MKTGAFYLGQNRCEFSVWAPFVRKLGLRVIGAGGKETPFEMKKDGNGYWRVAAEGVAPGSRYYYTLDGGRRRADPASHYQPDGVEGPSEVVDHGAFAWEDALWKAAPIGEMIIYEIHAGTFTPEGTFEAVIPRLGELKELGVNALEIMPVSQFPGERNWGYDGVFHYAVQNSYGGPAGLKRLVNECHKNGLSVILDVVYNHFGPEGNYLGEFGPYFTDRYKTPWGDAINFDGAYSDPVREFFIENALHWFANYRIDALRLDAVHAVFDMSATPFLEVLRGKTREFASGAGRNHYLMAESDINDPALIRPPELCGLGLDAIWCDDFHHSLHALLTRESDGYYADFGSVFDLAESFRQGFAYAGRYSRYRKKTFGAPVKDAAPGRLIVFCQNHDQVGNRLSGERLSGLVSFEALKLAALATLLSPFVPLIFMGEEYAEDAPFLYFIDHSGRELAAATAAGRKDEFKGFNWKGEPMDPQGLDTFLKSRLRWEDRGYGRHRILLEFYKKLIAMRKGLAAFSSEGRGSGIKVSGDEDKKTLLINRGAGLEMAFLLLNFNDRDVTLDVSLPEGIWVKALDSAEARWDGTGSGLADVIGMSEEVTISALSAAVYTREGA